MGIEAHLINTSEVKLWKCFGEIKRGSERERERERERARERER